MFLQVSVILFTRGGACSGGVPAPGGRGVWSWGVPGGDPSPTATAAGGMHSS